MATVSVRYIVGDVERLVLSAPSREGGGGQQLPDGTRPEPGGWNRFMVEVPDLDRMAAALHEAGVHFRSPVIGGVGGRQLIIEDPSGNPVELFSPTREEALERS